MERRFAAQAPDIGTCHFAATIGSFLNSDVWGVVWDAVEIVDDRVHVTVAGGHYELPLELAVDVATAVPITTGGQNGCTFVHFMDVAVSSDKGNLLALEKGDPLDTYRWLANTGRGDMVKSFLGSELIGLLADAATGRPVTVVAKERDELTADEWATAIKYGLARPRQHAYAVTGVNPNGEVTMWNPNRDGDPDPIPVDEFRDVMFNISFFPFPGDPPLPGLRESDQVLPPDVWRHRER